MKKFIRLKNLNETVKFELLTYHNVINYFGKIYKTIKVLKNDKIN